MDKANGLIIPKEYSKAADNVLATALVTTYTISMMEHRYNVEKDDAIKFSKQLTSEIKSIRIQLQSDIKDACDMGTELDEYVETEILPHYMDALSECKAHYLKYIKENTLLELQRTEGKGSDEWNSFMSHINQEYLLRVSTFKSMVFSWKDMFYMKSYGNIVEDEESPLIHMISVMLDRKWPTISKGTKYEQDDVMSE